MYHMLNRGGLDLAVLFAPLRTGRTEIKCAGTPVLPYAGVLHFRNGVDRTVMWPVPKQDGRALPTLN